ncbi:hypothetical protein MPL1_00632 [Methylophaga lonarensis MPL]|uniref:Uncharacterized protein n=1 Tax=Methylophaga lonarensis MPL TaxID=1286106 RepID=M7NZM0_9GAMM|nr:hypothetical protein MPL1_00632 [Methylophaga lonarensis MPL]
MRKLLWIRSPAILLVGNPELHQRRLQAGIRTHVEVVHQTDAFPHSVQWLYASFINIYRCGGSVGIAPTSRLTMIYIIAPEEPGILGTNRFSVKLM